MGGTVKYLTPKNLTFSFLNTEGEYQPNFFSLGLLILFCLSLKNFTGEKGFPTSFNFNWFIFNPMRSCMFNYHHHYYRQKINFLWCCWANYHLICSGMASRQLNEITANKQQKDQYRSHCKQRLGSSKVLCHVSHLTSFKRSYFSSSRQRHARVFCFQ